MEFGAGCVLELPVISIDRVTSVERDCFGWLGFGKCWQPLAIIILIDYYYFW